MSHDIVLMRVRTPISRWRYLKLRYRIWRTWRKASPGQRRILDDYAAYIDYLFLFGGKK